MSEPSTLANVSIHIEGVGNPVSYSSLVINQQLADVNDFSFKWRQEEGTPTLSGYIAFNRTHLAAEVTIDINGDFTFKGIIYSISCVEQDSNGITYLINGKGLFAKLDEIAESNTFYHKDFRHIFNTLNITQGTTLQLNPYITSELFYTVQYNQTAFEFYKMTAARYGEWLYYNGQEMVLGVPSGPALDISDTEIDNLTFRSRVEQSPVNVAGYDTFRGEEIRYHERTRPVEGTGFVATSMQAGQSIHSATEYAQFAVIGAATADILANRSVLQQQGRAASSVELTGTTFNSRLKLAGKINLTDNNNNSFGEYIVTKLHHYSAGPDNYQNFFSAVPGEVDSPPYTNPYLHMHCPAQMAKVVNNEDADGQDRVKVRFPWQATSETTPWLKVVVPHAGQGYGFRFLPEVDDIVYVDFINNDPEIPFVMGCVYTDNRQSEASHEGNNVKVIGTRTGRRLELDDDQGVVALRDNVRGSYPKNILLLKRKDSEIQMGMQSQTSDNDRSALVLNNDERLHLYVMEGNVPKTEIILEKAGSKITVNSKGDISLHADGSLNLSAANININASQELKMKGNAKGTKIEGQKIELEATTEFTAKGVTSKVEGSAKLELKGGAMVDIGAAIVKVN